jgi:hypothetical protein
MMIRISHNYLNPILQLPMYILWQSVLVVDETGVPEKKTDLPQVTDKLLSHNVATSTPHLSGIQTNNVCGDSD